MKVCLDAGHGGGSSGARGIYSLEKDINLKLILKLSEKLKNYGLDIVLTRDTDIFVSLQKRCDIANSQKCDYFVSIHCNSFSDTDVTGTETFYYPGDQPGSELAIAIQNAIIGYTGGNDKGVKASEFYVLKNTVMSAVLIECEFISNEATENMLNDEVWQDGFVESVVLGLHSCLGASIPVSEDTTDDTNNKNNDNNKHPIAGLTRATVQQMESFVHKVHPEAPYLARLYYDIGMEEGIRGDYAFAQAILETGYFMFAGIVRAEQNNYCGLGATGNGVSGASFSTPEEGVRAHIQHLKAYANKEPLKTDLVDPRFELVPRGSAPYIEDLGGKWAVPGNGYGESIINIWEKIMEE